MSKAAEKFYKRVAQEGKFTLLSDYKGPRAQIVARCNECGAVRTVQAGGFFRYGCSHGMQRQIAASKKRTGKTNKLGAKYIAEIEAKYPVQVIGEYKGYREPLRVRFNTCGHEQDITVDSVLFLEREPMCNQCARVGSRGEQRVRKYLEENNIKYKREVRFDSCKRERKLPFDFVVYNSKGEPAAAIEYQGAQHYKASAHWGGEERFQKVQEADAIKREWCKEHGLPLLAIKYTADVEAELKAWFPPVRKMKTRG